MKDRITIPIIHMQHYTSPSDCCMHIYLKVNFPDFQKMISSKICSPSDFHDWVDFIRYARDNEKELSLILEFADDTAAAASNDPNQELIDELRELRRFKKDVIPYLAIHNVFGYKIEYDPDNNCEPT